MTLVFTSSAHPYQKSEPSYRLVDEELGHVPSLYLLPVSLKFYRGSSPAKLPINPRVGEKLVRMLPPLNPLPDPSPPTPLTFLSNN